MAGEKAKGAPDEVASLFIPDTIPVLLPFAEMKMCFFSLVGFKGNRLHYRKYCYFSGAEANRRFSVFFGRGVPFNLQNQRPRISAPFLVRGRCTLTGPGPQPCFSTSVEVDQGRPNLAAIGLDL